MRCSQAPRDPWAPGPGHSLSRLLSTGSFAVHQGPSCPWALKTLWMVVSGPGWAPVCSRLLGVKPCLGQQVSQGISSSPTGPALRPLWFRSSTKPLPGLAGCHRESTACGGPLAFGQLIAAEPRPALFSCFALKGQGRLSTFKSTGLNLRDALQGPWGLHLRPSSRFPPTQCVCAYDLGRGRSLAPSSPSGSQSSLGTAQVCALLEEGVYDQAQRTGSVRAHTGRAPLRSPQLSPGRIPNEGM